MTDSRRVTREPRTNAGRTLERIVRNAMPAADGVADFIVRIEDEAALPAEPAASGRWSDTVGLPPLPQVDDTTHPFQAPEPPATPPVSEDVDMMWDGVADGLRDFGMGERDIARFIDYHRPAIEAAIRGDSAGTLDVERLDAAIVEALNAVDDEWTAGELADLAAAEYARLTEADRDT